MRGRWDHRTPDEVQPAPRDNTSRYIYAQVNVWDRTYDLIHPEAAMEIASWWHGPGRLDTAITAFASHGEVKIHGIDGWDDCAGFGPDLGDAVRAILAKSGGSEIDITCLRALGAYVDEVEQHATRYRRSQWSWQGHTMMGTDTVDVESCLTCGAVGLLRPDSPDGDYGSYHGGDGGLLIECTGRVDLAHGSERHCEADNGRGCADDQLTGTCKHTDHVCNCQLCY